VSAYHLFWTTIPKWNCIPE